MFCSKCIVLKKNLSFHEQMVIHKSYSSPESVVNKMCYNFVQLHNTGNAEICEYFVIESTGQTYKGVQVTWTLIN